MERSKDWIDEAEGDLEHAKSDAERGYYNWACFSAQQAAEKSSGSVRVFYSKYDTEWLVQEIRKKMEELNEKLSISMVVLFGSYAKGNYTVASDVDLLVVYKGEEKEDAYNSIKSILNIPRLEPHVYSQREYEDMKGVINKMIEDGIVLS